MARLITAEAFPEEVTTLQVSWGLQMAAVHNSLPSSTDTQGEEAGYLRLGGTPVPLQEVGLYFNQPGAGSSGEGSEHGPGLDTTPTVLTTWAHTPGSLSHPSPNAGAEIHNFPLHRKWSGSQQGWSVVL